MPPPFRYCTSRPHFLADLEVGNSFLYVANVSGFREPCVPLRQCFSLLVRRHSTTHEEPDMISESRVLSYRCEISDSVKSVYEGLPPSYKPFIAAFSPCW